MRRPGLCITDGISFCSILISVLILFDVEKIGRATVYRDRCRSGDRPVL